MELIGTTQERNRTMVYWQKCPTTSVIAYNIILYKSLVIRNKYSTCQCYTLNSVIFSKVLL